MTLPRLWAMLAVALPVLAALLAGLSTVDLAYHLRAGAEMLDGRGIPRADTWTFTIAGRPWLDQQWGAQVALASVERLAGWTGLAVLRAALVGATFGLVALAARRQGVGTRTGAGLALGAFVVAAVALALRPQLFGMVLFALVLLLLVERHRHPRSLWLSVPILALWANLHGSFVLGPALLGWAWLEDLATPDLPARVRHRSLLVALLATVASVLNPWGLEVWAYAIGLTADRNVTARITEWQPTSVRDVPGLLFYGSGVLVALVLARRRTAGLALSTRWPAIAVLAGFFVLGVLAARGAAWWPLIAAVVVAGLIARERAAAAPEPPEGPRLRRLNLIIALTLIAGGIALLPVWRPLDPRLGAPTGLLSEAPPGITAQVRGLAEPGDRLFVPQPWGSWFEYAVPAATVAVDSRVELFPSSVWDDYESVIAGGDGWNATLHRWDVSLVVTGEGGEAFADRLERAGWHRLYTGADGGVFARSAR